MELVKKPSRILTEILFSQPIKLANIKLDYQEPKYNYK